MDHRVVRVAEHQNHVHGPGGPRTGRRRAQAFPRGGEGLLDPLPHPGLPHPFQGRRKARVVPVEREPAARTVLLDEVPDPHRAHHLLQRGEHLAQGVGPSGDGAAQEVEVGGGGVMDDDLHTGGP
ncbi:hypothetical protein SGRI78S_03050 [Streptomyces griseus subsp. griseus]